MTVASPRPAGRLMSAAIAPTSETRVLPRGMVFGAFTRTAADYHARGLNVLPIVTGEKVPPRGLLWKRWQRTPQTSAEIAALVAQYPEADIGIILGGLLDIDTDSEEAERALRDLALPVPATACWRSPRGVHRLYRTETPLPSRIRLRPGLDVLSGTRYAIAPDSVGRAWIDGLGLEALAVLPSDWHEVLRSLRRHTLQTTEHDGAEAGARNGLLAALCGRWMTRGDCLSDAALIRRAVAWGRTCRPPIEPAECETVAASILQTRARTRHPAHTLLLRVRDLQLGPTDRLTALALASHQQELGLAGETFAAPMRLMAGLVGVDYSTLSRIYRRLEAAGLIALLPGRDPISGRRISTVRFRP